MARVHTLDAIADEFGVSQRTLRRRIVGDLIRFDDGRTLRVIRNARKVWVADAELARFLGESEKSA